MARLKSLLKIEGTLDGMTFYKKDGKYWVKTKGGIESGRLKSDPAFARTRENNAEFTEVAKANKFFRTAWATQRADVKDNSVTYRLTSELFKAIKQDLISARGERKIGIDNLAQCCRVLHHVANTFHVNRLERIIFEDAKLEVFGNETIRIVS